MVDITYLRKDVLLEGVGAVSSFYFTSYEFLECFFDLVVLEACLAAFDIVDEEPCIGLRQFPVQYEKYLLHEIAAIVFW